MKATHIGGLLIVINVVDISRQAEVCYFHHVVLGYQNIASGEVPVDALQKWQKWIDVLRVRFSNTTSAEHLLFKLIPLPLFDLKYFYFMLTFLEDKYSMPRATW